MNGFGRGEKLKLNEREREQTWLNGGEASAIDLRFALYVWEGG